MGIMDILAKLQCKVLDAASVEFIRHNYQLQQDNIDQ